MIFAFLRELFSRKSTAAELERFIRIEYPRDYRMLKAEGVRDFRPLVESILSFHA